MDSELLNAVSAIGRLRPIRSEDFSPLSEAEITEAESIIAVSLPEPYRSFMREYGGVSYDEIVEVHMKEPFQGGNTFFELLFGDKSDDTYSLLENIAIYRGRIPHQLIPIGEDSGNVICLGIYGRRRGKIYYWDHKKEEDPRDYLEYFGVPMPPSLMFSNIYLIADSFLDFFKQMRIYDFEKNAQEAPDPTIGNDA
jgi:hypothetical protein